MPQLPVPPGEPGRSAPPPSGNPESVDRFLDLLARLIARRHFLAGSQEPAASPGGNLSVPTTPAAGVQSIRMHRKGTRSPGNRTPCSESVR